MVGLPDPEVAASDAAFAWRLIVRPPRSLAPRRLVPQASRLDTLLMCTRQIGLLSPRDILEVIRTFTCRFLGVLPAQRM